MFQRIKDAVSLLRSRAYVFINEKTATHSGKFKGLEPFAVLTSLLAIGENVKQQAEDFEKEYFPKKTKKGATNARNKVGRPKGSSNKQAKVR